MLTRLSKSVAIIDTRALGESNVVAAYLVTGKETALIDMGYQSSVETVVDDLAKQGIGRDELDYLLPTHVHLDHSGSCGALAKKFTNASIRVHPKGEPHLADPARLWKGAGELFGEELMLRYGRPDPVDPKRLRIASDGDLIDLGRGTRLRTVWTPGHASHHLSYELEGHSVFFTGDAVGIYYLAFPILVPTTPPTSFNLEQTLQSLDRIGASSPSEFYTPHFGIVRNAMQWLSENVQALQHWNKSLVNMKEMGLSDESMTEALTNEVCKRMSRPLSETPDYVRISIKVSVLGFLRYLQR